MVIPLKAGSTFVDIFTNELKHQHKINYLPGRTLSETNENKNSVEHCPKQRKIKTRQCAREY